MGLQMCPIMCPLTTTAMAIEHNLEGQVVQQGDDFGDQRHDDLGQYSKR